MIVLLVLTLGNIYESFINKRHNLIFDISLFLQYIHNISSKGCALYWSVAVSEKF